MCVMSTLANDAAAMIDSNNAVRTRAGRGGVCVEFTGFMVDTFGLRA
jgi:hypothetical protein